MLAPAGAEAGGREKEGEEACFEEHAVGLVLAEVLRDGDPAEEADPADEERGAWDEVERDENGRDEPGPDEDHEGMVGGAEPEERRGEPEALIAELAEGVEVGCRREDAAGAAHAEGPGNRGATKADR